MNVIEALEAAGGNKTVAAKSLGIARTTYCDRLSKALEGVDPIDTVVPQSPDVQLNILSQQIRRLQRELINREKDSIEADEVRRYILELGEHSVQPPEWVNNRDKHPYNHGVPALMLSDLHYGEVVKAEEVFYVNEYDSNIAEARIRKTMDRTIHLTHNVLREPKFPGIVLVLGGDNINGMIHEELTVGSDKRLMEQILGIADILHGVILKALKVYGRVFIPGVPGNHGRATFKTWTKFTAATNADWLVYQLLERYLAQQVARGDIVFMCPPARDVTFRIAGRGYRLSHGDQFRGGDSIIGPLGPVTRGDQKKRTMAMGLPHDREMYDTLLIGHFHQLLMMSRLIMNGATKGYDEYSLSNNFSYQPPQQALWMTHERHGINHYMPVLCDEPAPLDKIPAWIEWKEQRELTTADMIASTMEWVGNVPTERE